jgi:hypothetical protein
VPLLSALDNIPAPAERANIPVFPERRHGDDERRLDHGLVAASAFRAHGESVVWLHENRALA